MNKSIIFITLDITLRGGIERFIANMSEIFSSNGMEVSIYSLQKTYSQPLYTIPDNVKIIYLTNFRHHQKLYKIISIWACIKFLFLLPNKKYQITISTFPIITIVLCLLKKNTLAKTIASEHSTYLAHNKMIRALRLWAYKYVSCVVTQTQDGVQKFLSAGIQCKRIPNPTTDFKDLRQWRIKYKLENDGGFQCLSIARFVEVKQLDHYIEVARIVHSINTEIKFILIGTGPLESHLKSLILKNNLNNIFTILPPTPHVNDYYASSDVYLVTSSSEAFPMTVLEALSFGLPVISYDELVGPKEIIQDGQSGYLCHQNNPNSIAQRIIELHSNRQLHKKMCEQALETSLQFSPRQILDQWVDIL